MNIHRIFYPVLALGPGRRIGIWTRGCTRGCVGCMSPDMQPVSPACEMLLDSIKQACARVFSRNPVDGVTISGGEPLDQWEDLTDLLEFLSRYTEDILLYTGYGTDELAADERLDTLARTVSVLITGPYMEEANDGLPLRGSSNQEILFLSPAVKDRYLPLLEGNRVVQPVEAGAQAFLIGIMG